jgi:uncharacterized protein
MKPLVNLRHLEDGPVTLTGQLTVEELDLDPMDEVIHLTHELSYDVEVEKVDHAILAQGTLEMDLDCDCVRCLKPHQQKVLLENWAAHLPLEGEEKVAVHNDVVDLTPYIREDMVLAFPQHPLCEPECKGLKGRENDPNLSGAGQSDSASSAWAVLNKLKL